MEVNARQQGTDPKTEAADSKTRILNEAQRLFAEVGYDGARVDEIARRAKVNKALIYYYYKGKADILTRIVERLLADAEELKQRAPEPPVPQSGQDAGADARLAYERYLDEWIDFLETRRDVLSIVLMQALKKRDQPGALFQLLEDHLQLSIDRRSDAGKRSVKNPLDFRLQAFFLGFLPMIGFVLMKDKWCHRHGYDPAQAREAFSRLYLQEYVVDTITRLTE